MPSLKSQRALLFSSTLALAIQVTLLIEAIPLKAACLEGRPPILHALLPVKDFSYQIFDASPNHPKETILLLHGLGGRKETFYRFATELSQDYRVIALDQRGHGNTPALGEDYSPTAMANDLNRFLDEHQFGKVHVLGHSMGGRTAMRFAALYPEKVRSVIIEDIHMKGFSKEKAAVAETLEVARHVRAAFPSLTFADEGAASQALGRLYSPEEVEDFIDESKRGLDGSVTLRQRPEVSILAYNQGFAEDLTDALQTSKAPILFIQADKDKGGKLFEKGVDHIRETRPDAQIIPIPGTGHSIHKDPRFLLVVKTFLQNKH